jgi:serine/threonine-protein kinase
VASPTEILPDYPPALAAIVLKALAKDAGERYQTAEDLRVALESWIASCAASVSERDIAALMRKTLGSEIDDKQKKINEAAAKLKEGPTAHSETPTTAGMPSPSTPTREGASTVDRGVATGGLREKSTSWWLPVGAGLAVLALVVVLAKGTLGTVRPEPVAPAAAPIPTIVTAPVTAHEPAPPAPVVPEPPAAAREVSITVRTIPHNASIRIDDGEPINAPYTLQTPSSSEQRTIRASAPNFATATRQVAFDQTRDIVIELTPLPGQRKKPRGRSEAAPASTAPIEIRNVTPREPGVLPTTRPRALDEDNPFAR